MNKIQGKLAIGTIIGTAKVVGIGEQQRVDQNSSRIKYELICECGETTFRTKESLNKSIARGMGFYCMTCAQKYKHCQHDDNGVRLPGQEDKFVKMKPKKEDSRRQESRYYTIAELVGLHDWGYSPR